jgi:hypothetical protein
MEYGVGGGREAKTSLKTLEACNSKILILCVLCDLLRPFPQVRASTKKRRVVRRLID